MPGDQPSRRNFTLGAAAAVTAFAVPATAALAQDAGAGLGASREARSLGEAKPTEGKLTIDLPEIAENGNTVPFTVIGRQPDDGEGHVKAIHVIATANPQPGVATFRLTPLSGKAAVSSRMRLASTQDVIAIAELSDGRFLMAKRPVKVTIGGCGG